MTKLLRRKHTYWLLGSLVLFLGWIGAGRWHLPLPAGTAQAGNPGPDLAALADGVICFGYVDLEQGVTSLSPLAPGQVTKIGIREGDSVHAGQTLVQLDDRTARAHLREAEINVQAAEEQLAEAHKLPQQQQRKVAQQRAVLEALRHRLEAAAATLENKRALAQKNLVNTTEIRLAQAQVDELEAMQRGENEKARELALEDPGEATRRAQLQLDVRRLHLDSARRELEECTLKAPVDGTVLRVLVNVGDVLGVAAKQPAVLFCPRGPRIIRAEVEQEFAGRVHVGQEALIHDDTTSGPLWHGRVVRRADWYTQRRSVSPDPVQFTDVRTLEFIVALDEGQAPLAIGQRVRVTIGTGTGSSTAAAGLTR